MAYRSAQGKMVDMSILAKKNEQVRAVGNMGVNARGDVVDSNNKVIQNRNASVAGAYNRTVKQYNPSHTQQAQPPLEADLSKEEQQMFEELDQEETVKPVVKETKKK